MKIINTTLFTQTIAVIGCVTGVCSLILNFYKILSEKPKIKIDDYKFYLNGFYTYNGDRYETNKILVINLRLINSSISPISFKSAILNYGNLTLWPSSQESLSHLSFHKGDTTTEYQLDKQLNFPLIIEPMQIVNCSLIFPFADELFNVYLQNESKPMKISVKLFTANKYIKFKTQIFELTKENIINNQKKNKNKLCYM